MLIQLIVYFRNYLRDLPQRRKIIAVCILVIHV